MRPGMDYVLDVLRGEAIRPDIRCSEWRYAFQVAEQERVLPFFAARLRHSRATLPDPILDDLSRAEQEMARSSFWWTSELRGILQAFAANALAVIPLKGPMLAERVYGGTNLRAMCDLDLLVEPQNFNAAGTLLEKLGFVPKRNPDELHLQFLRGTTLVELHFDVVNPMEFRFDTSAAWKRARRREFLGQPVWQFAASDELLLLCLHSARHHFQYLSHVLDIALALNCLTPEIDPDAYDLESTAGLRLFLFLGRAMAMHLDPLCKSGPDIRVPAKTAAHMEKIADRLWAVMLEQPSLPPNWLAQHVLYFEAETTTAGRLWWLAKDFCILAARLTPKDFDFAAQYGVERRGLVWILRQLRLLAGLCGLRLYP